MRLRAILAIVTLLVASTAFAQGTVQLPAFSFNTVNTTVTAPDGGTIGLGGVARASSGRTERSVPMLGKLPYAGRLFNNRGIGQDYSNGYTTVTPRIIILEEEEAKLGLPDYNSGAPTDAARTERDRSPGVATFTTCGGQHPVSRATPTTPWPQPGRDPPS